MTRSKQSSGSQAKSGKAERERIMESIAVAEAIADQVRVRIRVGVAGKAVVVASGIATNTTIFAASAIRMSILFDFHPATARATTMAATAATATGWIL